MHLRQCQLTGTQGVRVHKQKMVVVPVVNLQKVMRSLLSLEPVPECRSLCCSEVAVWTPVNRSSALHIVTQRGAVWTHVVNVLLVIPWPQVILPAVFSIHIKSCSMVWSEKFQLQNASRRRMVKYPFSVNWVYSSIGIVCFKATICCKYSHAAFA